MSTSLSSCPTAQLAPRPMPVPTPSDLAALDSDGQRRLHADLEQMLESHNVGGPGALVIPGEYLEGVIAR
jgi:hypothetical protein